MLKSTPGFAECLLNRRPVRAEDEKIVDVANRADAVAIHATIEVCKEQVAQERRQATSLSDSLVAIRVEARKLPELCESVHVVGKASGEAARESGLASGTPVVIGGGDGVCATCGAGVVEPSESYIYLGTSTWMALASPEPRSPR